MARTKTLTKKRQRELHICLTRFPNFHVSGSIKGMKDRYYGKHALLVRCGSRIYNVTSKPEIYHLAR